MDEKRNNMRSEDGVIPPISSSASHNRSFLNSPGMSTRAATRRGVRHVGGEGSRYAGCLCCYTAALGKSGLPPEHAGEGRHRLLFVLVLVIT